MLLGSGLSLGSSSPPNVHTVSPQSLLPVHDFKYHQNASCTHSDISPSSNLSPEISSYNWQLYCKVHYVLGFPYVSSHNFPNTHQTYFSLINSTKSHEFPRTQPFFCSHLPGSIYVSQKHESQLCLLLCIQTLAMLELSSFMLQLASSFLLMLPMICT